MELTNFAEQSISTFVNQEDIDNLLIRLIGYSHQLAGFRNANPADFAFDANELGIELRKNHLKWLTPSEVEFAFRAGALGEYGDYKGLNMRVYTHWLNSYLNSTERQTFLEKKKEYINSSRQICHKSEPSEEEKQAIIYNGLKKAYKEFCAKKEGNLQEDPPIKGTIGEAAAGIKNSLQSRIDEMYRKILISKGLISDRESLNEGFERMYYNKINL